MRAVVPFDAEDPKTRLAALLDPDERRAFARVLLSDVLAALEPVLRDASDPDVPDWPPTVVSTGPVDVAVPVAVAEHGLDELVDDRLAEGPLAVIMADLGLATPAALERLFRPSADVVVAPGRGGGTNALAIRDTAFRVDFHGVSLRDHRRIAHECGATLAEVDSMRLATDVDEPADLVELLLHGEGEAPSWLRDRGFEVVVENGRATVERS